MSQNQKLRFSPLKKKKTTKIISDTPDRQKPKRMGKIRKNVEISVDILESIEKSKASSLKKHFKQS